MDTDNKNAAIGCLFLIIFIFSISGIFAIAEEDYSTAFLYCLPFICTALLYFINYNSMSVESKNVVVGCLILLSLIFRPIAHFAGCNMP